MWIETSGTCYTCPDRGKRQVILFISTFASGGHKQWNLLKTKSMESLEWHQSPFYYRTWFTMSTCVSFYTLTAVWVDSILTATTIQTWLGLTVVNICIQMQWKKERGQNGYNHREIITKKEMSGFITLSLSAVLYAHKDMARYNDDMKHCQHKSLVLACTDTGPAGRTFVHDPFLWGKFHAICKFEMFALQTT